MRITPFASHFGTWIHGGPWIHKILGDLDPPARCEVDINMVFKGFQTDSQRIIIKEKQSEEKDQVIQRIN